MRSCSPFIRTVAKHQIFVARERIENRIFARVRFLDTTHESELERNPEPMAGTLRKNSRPSYLARISGDWELKTLTPSWFRVVSCDKYVICSFHVWHLSAPLWVATQCKSMEQLSWIVFAG